jgi:hypothetical protein
LPSKEKKVHLGDEVRIGLARPKKREEKKPAPERHYGPPPPREEGHRRPLRRADLTVVFLDQYAEIQQSSPNFIPPRRELRWKPPYVVPHDSVTPYSLDQGTGIRRYSDGTTFVTYRQSFDRMPMSFLHAQDYGLSFVLNGTTYPLSPSTPEWIERKSPTERQADLITLDEETGSDHSAEIALLEFEIAEWAAAYESLETYWNPVNLDWERNYANFKKRLTGNADFSLACSGPNFEAFDPFDTANFKVTQGDFEDDEVEVEKLKSKVRRATTYDLRIGLIPQRWNFEINYFAWHYQARFDENPSRVVKHVRTGSGSLAAITAPFVLSTDPGEINTFTRTVSTYAAGVFSSITSVNSEVVLTGLPDETNHLFYKFENDVDATGLNPVLSIDLAFELSDPPFTLTLIERSNANITVTQADSPAEKLVGLFSVRGDTFFVYRKTSLGRGGSVYSGPFDAVSTRFSSPDPFFISYVNPILQSLSRDFSYYDPSNLRAHDTV